MPLSSKASKPREESAINQSNASGRIEYPDNAQDAKFDLKWLS